MEITESKVRLGELVGLEDLLYESDDLRIIDINLLIIKNYSGYLDYYSPAPKVIITIVRRGKLTNIRVTLDTRAEVSCISLNIVLRFKILITYSTRIAL
jgi:predicted metalloprotease with PDZ domain